MFLLPCLHDSLCLLYGVGVCSLDAAIIISVRPESDTLLVFVDEKRSHMSLVCIGHLSSIY